MALNNIGFENTESMETIELDIKVNNTHNVENLGKYSYEDALDITGTFGIIVMLIKTKSNHRTSRRQRVWVDVILMKTIPTR